MKTTVHYTVADFTFSVTADSQIVGRMSSFEPFRESVCCSDILFYASVHLTPTPSTHLSGMEPVEDISNDFGRIRMYRGEECYHFEVTFGDSDASHTMTVDTGFTQADIHLNSSDIYQTIALSSLLHILYSMAILPKGGVMTHASCVTLDGKGYIFLGKSGTGKSTHASLWLQNFTGCSLLNDDNPVIRNIDGVINVYGAPWSGKTPCYKKASAPLHGIVRLEQATVNRYIPLTEASAFAGLLPSCSVIQSDCTLTEYLYRTLISVCENTNIGLLRCRPDNEAASICRDSLCIKKK